MEYKKILNKVLAFLKSKIVIIISLVLFAPLGIFLLWKYSTWSNRTKWILTVLSSVIFIWATIAYIQSTPEIELKYIPTNAEVESSEYTVEGKLIPSFSKLKINGDDVSVDSGGKFSYSIQLKDGENEIVLTATNAGKTTEIKRNIKKLSAEKIAQRKAEAEARAKAGAEVKTEKKAQEEEKQRQENSPVNKITSIVKSVGGFEVTIWDINGDMANENTPPPYEVIVNTNQIPNCGGAKAGLYDVMNKLYTDDSVKDKIARVKFSAMGYLRASLGSSDVSKDKNNSNYWSGSSNFWATFLVYKPYEDETGQIEQRTWGVSINNCK